MTAALARRVTTVLLSLAVLAGLMTAPANAKQRVVRGGFTATAMPLPVYGMGGCATGIEGRHKVSHPFEAPFAGWFHVGLSFEGDWDLYLADADGVLIAESYENKPAPFGPTQTINRFLKAGEKVHIVACNWTGGPEAEARYVHRAGRPWPGPPTGQVTHEEVQNYVLPAAATSEGYIYCVGNLSGCATFPIWGNDRSVSIELVDSHVSQVAFRVYQFHRQTFSYGKVYCGSTKGPIEVEPRADLLGVMILATPCDGDPPRTPTTGTVRAEFTG